ncbi:MAG: hypothetical protein R6U57_03190 [Anaerolineales bacterium]
MKDIMGRKESIWKRWTGWVQSHLAGFKRYPFFKAEGGRSLPAALITLAVGSLLLTPFLSFVSTRSLGIRAADETFNEQYASDAGVEFGIWTLLNDNTFRAQADANPGTTLPLPFPDLINGYTPAVDVTAISIGSWTWNPPPFPPLSISQGGDMVYTGGNLIYVLQGGNSKGFWRYDIANHTWMGLKNTPINVRSGGGLVYPGGNYIYAFFNNKSQGKGNKTDFWRYSISNDHWKRMAPTPQKIGNNTALASPGGNFIYVLPGKQQNFWAYNIFGNSWSNLSPAPGNIGAGTSLISFGGGALLAFQGNSTNFWIYNISTDNWGALQSTPDKVRDGGSLAYHSGNYVYAFQGSATSFWRYNMTMNTWAVLTDAPGNIGSGGSLVFTGAEGGFALHGGGNNAFWRFDVTPPQYDIHSSAGSVDTTARIKMDGSNQNVLFWDIE